MATVKEFQKAMELGLTSGISKKEMREIGDIIADLVRTRTRLGFGVNAVGTPKVPLKPLAESTKKARRRNRNLSPLTSPSKSNLTQTGALLESLSVIESSLREGYLEIGPQGSRKHGSLNNEEVGKAVAQRGRSFTPLSSTELKRLVDETTERSLNAIKRQLTKLNR
jgi:hypothetical protein